MCKAPTTLHLQRSTKLLVDLTTASAMAAVEADLTLSNSSSSVASDSLKGNS